MQFRLPKPLHGWREFVGEIAIIVIGVLIALGAQSLVEQWRWRNEVRTATAAFQDELLQASGIAYERLIIEPCLQGRIGDLAHALDNGDGPWKALPMAFGKTVYPNVMPVAYRAPSRQLRTDGWKNAIANGSLNHLPSDRVRELSSLYDQISAFRDLQDEEARAAASLTPLAFNRHLDSGNRTDMLGSLAEVDRINALMAIDASQIIEAVGALQLHFAASEIAEMRQEIVTTQRAIRGTCVVNLPLNMG